MTRNFTPHLILFTMLAYGASVALTLGSLDALAAIVALGVLVDVQFERRLREVV